MSSTDRQHIVRVPGSRRVQLTPVPEADAEPVAADETTEAPPETGGASGPNDERLRADVPPHY